MRASKVFIMNKKKYASLNIIKRDGIGDFLIFLLSANQIKINLNHIKLTFYTKELTAEFGRILLPDARFKSEESFLGLIRDFPGRKNKLSIISTYSDSVGGKHKRIGLLLGCKSISMGQFSHRNPLKYLANNFGRLFISVVKIKEKNEFYRYLKFIEHLVDEKIFNHGERIEPAFDREKKSTSSDTKLITIFPGASELEKRWSIDKFLHVAAELNKFGEVNIVLGPEEEELAEPVRQWLKNSPENINLLVKLGARELIELVSRTDLVISNDSMAIHLAAYLKVPSVCIAWGVRQFRFLSHLTDFNVDVISESCQLLPCVRCGRPEEERFSCIRDVTVERVLDAAREKLVGK